MTPAMEANPFRMICVREVGAFTVGAVYHAYDEDDCHVFAQDDFGLMRSCPKDMFVPDNGDVATAEEKMGKCL